MGTVERPGGLGHATAGVAGDADAHEAKTLSRQVFDVLGDRLALRASDIELFTSTGCCFEEWCRWEAVAAFSHHRPEDDRGGPDAAGAAGEAGAAWSGRAGWKVQPRLPYASVGVTGSRETADLLVSDPARGGRVLVELSIIHDWSRNEWIDKLDGDTEKLSRAIAPGIERLQVIVAASRESPIDVNPIWQQWLGMSKVWNRPTDLKRVMPLGVVGELSLLGWVLTGPA